MTSNYSSLPADQGNITPTLVVSDLDGTLLTSKETITSRTSHVLSWLHAHQVPIVLATGRPPRDLMPIVEQLDFRPVCVCANGAVVYDTKTQELDYIGVLSAIDVRDCIEKTQAVLPEAGYAIEIPQLSASFYCSSNYQHPYDAPLTVPLRTIHELYQPAVKLLICVPERSSESLLGIVRSVLPSHYEVCYSSGEGLVEVSAHGVNKATGVAYVVQLYKYDSERIIAFGDMNNDILLLQSVWKGIAMANASPELKHLIGCWTDNDNNHDGVAKELMRYWPHIPLRAIS